MPTKKGKVYDYESQYNLSQQELVKRLADMTGILSKQPVTPVPQSKGRAFKRQDTTDLTCEKVKVKIAKNQDNRTVSIEFFSYPFLKSEPDFAHEFSFEEFEELTQVFEEVDSEIE